MNYDIVEALSQIAREKGVDLQILVDRLEASLLSAAKRKHGANANIVVNFDESAGGIEMLMTKTVVGHVSDRGLELTATEARRYQANASVGDDVVIPLDIAEFGRNAISAAKQVLIQGVREAERERVFSDFSDKVGSVVRGVVQQVDRGNIILKLDTAEAIIPAREVMHRDRFRQREMVRAIVIKVDKEARGPQVVLSRTHPDFLVKLFEAEVPEIAERTVEVKAVAREAGHRSKIAVASNDPRIDAVGACVGIKGSRVQSIVKELGGERIDIVPWSVDPTVFVSRSLSPAKVLDVAIDHDSGTATLLVADDQLSLAIGKLGQNVRLGVKLTNWKIEVHSESEVSAKDAAAEVDLTVAELDGATEQLAKLLGDAGIINATDIEHVGLDGLRDVEVFETVAEKVYGMAIAALATRRAEAAARAVEEEPDPADEEPATQGEALFKAGAEGDEDASESESGPESAAEASREDGAEPVEADASEEAGTPVAEDASGEAEEGEPVAQAQEAPAEDAVVDEPAEESDRKDQQVSVEDGPASA